MLRRLLVDSAIYTTAGVVPGLAALALLPVYTRYLRPEDYGAVDLVTLGYTIVTVIATLEIHQGLARHLPAVLDATERRALSSTALWFTTFSALVAAALMFITAPAIVPRLISADVDISLWQIGSGTALLGAVSGIALRQLRWSLRPVAYITATSTITVVTGAVTVILLVNTSVGAPSLLIGQGSGSASGLVLAWSLARADLGWCLDWSAARRMLRFSAPLVVSTLGVLAAGQASRWVVAHVGSLEQAGVFGVASRITGVLGLAASGVQLALGPIIYASYRQPGASGDIARSFRVFWAGGIVLWSGLTLLAPELLGLLVSPAFQDARHLIAPMGAAALLAQATMFAPGLEIAHRTGVVAAISVLTGTTNLLLAWVGVAHWGALGAAAAMCMSALLQAIGIFTLSHRHYPVAHFGSRLAFGSTLAVAIVCLTLIDRGLPALVHSRPWRALSLVVVMGLCWICIARPSEVRKIAAQ